MAKPKKQVKKKGRPKPWHTSKPTPMQPRFIERVITKSWTPDPKHAVTGWMKGRILEETVRGAVWRALKLATRKHVDAAVRQVDAPRRRIRFIASQQAVDRDGEVVVQAGIEISRFLRNPVLLQDHDPRLPLGKVTSLSVEKLGGVESLVGAAEILPAGTSARVDETWAAIQFGARAAISIGFMSLESDRTPVLPDQRGLTYRRVELLEVSVVAIPSCPSCLITEKRARALNHCGLQAAVKAGVQRALVGR